MAHMVFVRRVEAWRQDAITVTRPRLGPAVFRAQKNYEYIGMDENHCVFCNAMSYEPGCIYSDSKVHWHGSGANKCVYCGSTSIGGGCLNSPHKNHER